MEQTARITQETNGDTGIQEVIPDGHSHCPISGLLCRIRLPDRIGIPWTRELHYRQGARKRLRAIEVYYDFDWVEQFSHNAATFRKGEHLADFVVSECRAGCTPALLLTVRDDVCASHTLEYGGRSVIVVNIDQYHAHSRSNAAAQFFISSFSGRLTRLRDLNEADIRVWAGDDVTKLEMLSRLGCRTPNGGTHPATIDDINRVFQLLPTVDGELVDSIIGLLQSKGVESEYLLKRLLCSGEVDDLSDAVEWLLDKDHRLAIRQLTRLQGPAKNKLAAVSAVLSLDRILNLWQTDQGVDSEQHWQTILTENLVVLSQVFAFPIVLIQGQAFLGGKQIDNRGASVTDFLCQNSLTKNVALVEIKKPGTKLLSSTPYRRDCYAIDSELNGAVIQVLTQRDSLVKECDALFHRSGIDAQAFAPKCVIIAGNTSQFTDKTQVKSFELFRNSLAGVEIVTFDELFGRIEKFLKLLLEECDSDDSLPLTAAPTS